MISRGVFRGAPWVFPTAMKILGLFELALDKRSEWLLNGGNYYYRLISTDLFYRVMTNLEIRNGTRSAPSLQIISDFQVNAVCREESVVC